MGNHEEAAIHTEQAVNALERHPGSPEVWERISDYRDAAEYRMAAKAASAEEIEDFVEWLKQTGRISSDAEKEGGSTGP